MKGNLGITQEEHETCRRVMGFPQPHFPDPQPLAEGQKQKQIILECSLNLGFRNQVLQKILATKF